MVRSTPPRAVLWSATARSVLEQMNGFGPDFHVLRVTGEPCARDSRCAEIDARFPSKPALGVFERLARIPGLDPRTGVTERRSHVAAEPTRPRPLQRSGEIRRTGDSRVSLLQIHVYRVFNRELELNECINRLLIWPIKPIIEHISIKFTLKTRLYIIIAVINITSICISHRGRG